MFTVGRNRVIGSIETGEKTPIEIVFSADLTFFYREDFSKFNRNLKQTDKQI